MTKKIGYTLLEILLVIAIIAVLTAMIAIIAINPGRQLAQSRDAERWSNINTVLNAVHQEALDNNKTVNAAITATCPATQAVDSGAAGAGADLSGLAPTYVAEMPEDPTAASGVDTGYDICVSNSRVTVSAPAGEIDTAISATR